MSKCYSEGPGQQSPVRHDAPVKGSPLYTLFACMLFTAWLLGAATYTYFFHFLIFHSFLIP